MAKLSCENDLSIVLCGDAGSGIQTVESALTKILKFEGYNVFANKEYMSRIRGGANSVQIRVTSNPVFAYVDRIDVLVPLSRGAIGHLSQRIKAGTVVLGDREFLGEDVKPVEAQFMDVPLMNAALAIGGAIFANTIATGLAAGMLGIKRESVQEYFKRLFAAKGDEVINKNIEAVDKGHEMGVGLVASGALKIAIRRNPQAVSDIAVNGTEAVSLGAISGGCNFISSYPMSPGTGVLTFLAKNARKCGIVVEQVEDEISAINMALGAWYAGARAIVTTSGGGFALMQEGVSLAGAMESPIVIHLAQRPGPATGLPTRTEQGDLNFVLYSGHGEFPRAVFAPGTLNEAFLLARSAFELADRCQIPVFILTDQFLMDSFANTAAFGQGDRPVNHFIKTQKDYRRYELSADGISPRGIPGFGEGLVAVDSDEHDESGRITEDMGVRKRMTDKRLKKADLVRKLALAPELVGPKEYSNLVVGWGSTYGVIREGMELLGMKDTAFLHFGQVYPLHESVAGYLGRAKKIIVVENNATGQFANLLRTELGFEIKDRLLKYDGMPFAVEEIVEGVGRMLGGK